MHIVIGLALSFLSIWLFTLAVNTEEVEDGAEKVVKEPKESLVDMICRLAGWTMLVLTAVGLVGGWLAILIRPYLS